MEHDESNSKSRICLILFTKIAQFSMALLAARTIFETLTDLRTPGVLTLIGNIVTSLLQILATTLFKIFVIASVKLVFIASLKYLPLHLEEEYKVPGYYDRGHEVALRNEDPYRKTKGNTEFNDWHGDVNTFVKGEEEYPYYP